MLSVITALEFFQHYFSEMGHRDLLVTQNLSQAIKQPTLSYLTRSVRRRAATSKRTSMLFANLTKPARTGSVHVEIPPDDEVSQVLRADLFLEHIG